MMNVLLGVLSPVLLVFGLYHLLTWFNVAGINDRVYWKRVAIAAALGHFFLASGFLAFTYLDFLSNRTLLTSGLDYSTVLFNHSDFWNVLALYDTLPMVLIYIVFAPLNSAGLSGTGLLVLTLAIVFTAGTLQWYYIGGGIGAVLQKFWEGLKTGDDEEEWFQ